MPSFSSACQLFEVISNHFVKPKVSMRRIKPISAALTPVQRKDQRGILTK